MITVEVIISADGVEVRRKVLKYEVPGLFALDASDVSQDVGDFIEGDDLPIPPSHAQVTLGEALEIHERSKSSP